MKKIQLGLFLMAILFVVACQNTSSSSEGTNVNVEDEISEAMDLENGEENLEEIEVDIETNVEEDPEPEETTETEGDITETDTETTIKAKKVEEKKIVTEVKETKTTTPVVEKTRTPTKTTTKKTETKVVEKKEDKKVVVKEAEPVKQVAKPAKPALSHAIWDGLLRKYVSSTGKVNYAGFKKEKAKLQQYLDLLDMNPPLPNWSKNKEMAYWINVYNAHTVKLIVDNYPISSIMKLDAGNPWGVKRITIGSKKYSLDEIEKTKLLKKFKEPRVHFAVNCAAKSCPALLNKAWTENNINANYEAQTRKFINNKTFNQISKKSLKLSQIFEWYASDFGDVKTFVQKYTDVELKSNAGVSYIDYDWSLNN